MIAAVLPAAGAGERFKLDPTEAPKQFTGLAGRPVYMWSLTTLAAHAGIEKVVVVVPQLSLDAVQKDILSALPPDQSAKVAVTAGGLTRQDSVRNGLVYLSRMPSPPEFVMIHDAARPLLTSKLVDQVIESVTVNGACTVAIPVTDTIKRVKDNIARFTLDRNELVQIQTPQAARFDWMLEAHHRAVEEKIGTTDDSTILEHSGHKVHIVMGSSYNLKITNPEDLSICQSLAQVMKQRS